MNTYRITYVQNEVAICYVVANRAVFNDIYQYEHSNGKLIYAIVIAKNEDNALTIAKFIASEVSEKFLKKDSDSTMAL